MSHRVSGEMENGSLAGDPFSISLARPERFELPTFWFVGRRCVSFLSSPAGLMASVAAHGE